MGRQAQRRGGEWQGQEVLCPGKGAALSSHPVGRLRPGPAEDPLTTPASGTRGSGLPAPALLGAESAFENPEGIVSLRGQFAKGASGVRREVGPAAAPNGRVGQLLRPLSPSWGRGSCGHHGQTMETAPGPRTDARTAMGGKSVRWNTARPRRGGGSGMPPRKPQAQRPRPRRRRVRPCPRHVRRPRRQEADGAPGARDRLVGRACLLERRKYYGTGRGDGRTALRTGAKTADSRLGRWWGPWPGCESPTHPAPQVMGGKKNDGSPRARSGRSARERAASAGRSVLRLAGVGRGPTAVLKGVAEWAVAGPAFTRETAGDAETQRWPGWGWPGSRRSPSDPSLGGRCRTSFCIRRFEFIFLKRAAHCGCFLPPRAWSILARSAHPAPEQESWLREAPAGPGHGPRARGSPPRRTRSIPLRHQPPPGSGPPFVWLLG